MKMKCNPNLILRKVAGQSVLIPTGEMAQKFNGMINLNGPAAFIWEHMEQANSQEELVKMLLDAYEVDEDTARRDVAGFIATAVYVGYAEDEEQ